MAKPKKNDFEVAGIISENFNAFVSGNLPLLAEVGVYIKYNKILKYNT